MMTSQEQDTDPDSCRPVGAKTDTGLFKAFQSLFKKKKDETLREAIEEYIETPDSFVANAEEIEERALFSNILSLRDIRVDEVMVPRADIVAIDINISRDDLAELLSQKQVSRFPVYKDTLDNVLGTVHLKDIVADLLAGNDVNIAANITEIPIVAPTLPILDLLITMRQSRRHMALVVDEYGGIDGLVAVGDILESIIGEIDDEHDVESEPRLIEDDDGSVLADARVHVDDFEEKYGSHLNDDEREESDTLGGLIFSLAGRIPVRGEVITHDTGMVFEIMDADPRRVNLIRIRNIPSTVAA